MTSFTHLSTDVGGRRRTFHVVDGPYAPGRDLVLVLHGSRQSGAAHRRFTGHMFDTLARDRGAVVAYLDGYRGNWNDARAESAFPARLAGIDDVGFVRRVIADLVASHDVDPRRVHAVGYSNGGQMVLRLLHEAPGLLAGAAVVAATMPAPESFLAPSAELEPVPTPTLLVHGTRDPIVPYQGGRFPAFTRRVFRVDGVSLSAPGTARYLALRNGITTDPVVTRLAPPASARDRTWIEQTDYREDGLPPVRLLTVHGGGHTVPGPGRAPFFIGRTARSISTADVLAEHLAITAGSGTRHQSVKRGGRYHRRRITEQSG
ncbi:alpha/beta hydrolase family esterase [Promicromonospora sp. NPDC050880]|uniref:alpha/beta hydrolase family esterase n=1 Tax=Promicromonospora sp. NPDC050880 TaxID=3364406 RepID=UPI003793A9E6